MVQCTETQLMPNKWKFKQRSSKYVWSHVLQIVHSWRSLRHKESTWVKVFLLHSIFFLYLFELLVSDCFNVPEKLAITSQWNFTFVPIGRWWSADSFFFTFIDNFLIILICLVKIHINHFNFNRDNILNLLVNCQSRLHRGHTHAVFLNY